MSYKMKGFSGFKSPLKQNEYVQLFDDEGNQIREPYINKRLDAAEKIKNMPIAKGLKGEARSEKDKYTTTTAQEAVDAINKQLKKKKTKEIANKWKEKWIKEEEKIT